LRKWGKKRTIFRPNTQKQTFYNAPICPENTLHHQNIHAMLEKRMAASPPLDPEEGTETENANQ
jgi:hypothetical protein